MKKSLIIRGPQKTVLIGLLLALVTLIPYWQVRNHDFILLDDDGYVTANDHVKTGLTAKGITWAFTTTQPDYWHPLPWLSLMLDHEIYGLNPAGYHLTNLLLHILNTSLLFFILYLMTGALWRSAVVAALFALHPLHVESVAWVTERKGLLSATFWLLTMGCYAWYVQYPGLKRFCLLLLSFALGLMSKPMMMTLPFVLLLLDYWPLSRFGFGKAEGHSLSPDSPGHQVTKTGSAWVLVLEKTPLFMLSAISFYVTLILRQGENIMIPVEYRPLMLRIGNALTSYVQYIGNMIWPHDLAVFYPYPKALPLWQGVGAGLFLFAATLLIFRLLLRHPYLAVGWLWYLGTLVPVIGLVQWGQWPAMADRFTYVPLMGLYILMVWGISEMASKWRFHKALLALSAGTALSALIMGTWFQLAYWKNSIRLFERSLEVTHENHLIQTTLGNALRRQGKIWESMSHYREALRINPLFMDAHNGLGIAFFKQGKINEAIEHFQVALRYRPRDPKYHHNIGNAYMARGDLESAGRAYKRALALKPDFPEVLNNLGLYYARKGSLDRAMSLFEEALTLRPDFVDALNNLGRTFHEQGQFDRAITTTEKALKLDPQNDSLHTNLGLSLTQKELFSVARKAFHRALTINPVNPKALNGLATLDAKRGLMDRAIETRKKALAIDPYDAVAHYHIAVEYYFKREYALAIEHCDRAIALGYKEVEPEFLRHLEPFRHGK